jgi:lysozyme
MIEELKREIKADEGCVYKIYKCSAGELTFGIGHMVKESDPEYGYNVGAPVMPMRVNDAFDGDVDIALYDCHRVFPHFFMLPVEAQKILANMMFQLGINRFRTFKKMIAAVKDEDFDRAADEMRNSFWNKQTHARSERLIARMKAL